jgi:hypothetical protein
MGDGITRTPPKADKGGGGGDCPPLSQSMSSPACDTGGGLTSTKDDDFTVRSNLNLLLLVDSTGGMFEDPAVTVPIRGMSILDTCSVDTQQHLVCHTTILLSLDWLA